MASGDITVAGPFAPGVTNVQFAYSMPYSAGGSYDRAEAAAGAGPSHRAGAEARRHATRVCSDCRAPRDAGRRADVSRCSGPRPQGRGARIVRVQQPAACAAVAAICCHFACRCHPDRRRVGEHERKNRPFIGAGEARKAPRSVVRRTGGARRKHRAGTVDASVYTRKRAELVAALERVYAEIDRQAA